jgi:hypothetical protein
MHDDMVAVIEQRLGGRATDAIGGAGDQDAFHTVLRLVLAPGWEKPDQ